MKSRFVLLTIFILGVAFALVEMGRFFTSEKKHSKSNEIRIAILGDSATDEPLGFNETILTRLFTLIKEQDPSAVFFTGNLTLGLVKHDQKTRDSNPGHPPETDLYGNSWGKLGYIYNSNGYREQLKDFYEVIKNTLGDTPFYSAVGPQELNGPDSLQIFRDQFGFGKDVFVDLDLLVYTVAIGNAYFVVLQTDKFDSVQGKLIKNEITPELLEWLDKDLEGKSSLYPYLFVLGHSAGYSTTGTQGIYNGLDKNPELRNQFWNILRKNHVLVYFSGLEHLYDRSMREGVWQIISGGAGAPLYKRDVEKAFYHFLLLTIPQSKKGFPTIEVIDSEGKVNDKFELNRDQSMIYELRISSEG